MFGFLYRRVAMFVRRLITARPAGPYERIVFDAIYALGRQLRNGAMA